MKRTLSLMLAILLSVCLFPLTRHQATYAAKAATINSGEYVRVNASNPAQWKSGYITLRSLTKVNTSSNPIHFKPNENYAVYTGPGTWFPRGANGYASVGTNDNIDVYGIQAEENGRNAWMLVQYRIGSNNYRFGFITDFAILAEDCARIPIVDYVVSPNGKIKLPVNVTDDPLHSTRKIDTININSEIVPRAYLNNDWLLITYDSDAAGVDYRWGFIPASALIELGNSHSSSASSGGSSGSIVPGSVGYVNNGNGKRLNLRTGAGTGYASLGLYYTGCPVTVLSNPSNGWVKVRIGNTNQGSQTGYMMTEYLAFGNVSSSIKNALPTLKNTSSEYAVYDRPYLTNEQMVEGYSGRYPFGWIAYTTFGEDFYILGVLSDGWLHVKVKIGQYTGDTGFIPNQPNWK